MEDMNVLDETTIKYSLMNKNIKVCDFIAVIDEYGDIYFNEIARFGIMPFGFIDIQDYVEHRRAPKTREHIRQLLTLCNCNSLINFLDITLALSLNDSYWVKRSNSKLVWEDVSLYRHKFNDIIAYIAFDGQGFSQSTSSPEFTTNGISAKCWHRYEDIYLCKRGSEKSFEVISEYYASQLFSAFCKDSVNYRLNYLHNNVVSECKLFTSEEIGFVPCSKVLSGKTSIKEYLEFYKKFSDGEDFFRRMLIADAIVLNVDRHKGNFGFMIDNCTQELIKPAPVFDFNRCLLYDTEIISEDYFKQITPQIGADFNVVANQLLTDDIRKDLLDLRGFTLKSADVVSDRAEVMSYIINKQIDNILSGKSLYRAKFFTDGYYKR